MVTARLCDACETRRRDLKEVRQRLLDFTKTATAEEGWCYFCGDLSVDIEAPALTRLRAEAQRLQAIEVKARQLVDVFRGNGYGDWLAAAAMLDAVLDPRPRKGNAAAREFAARARACSPHPNRAPAAAGGLDTTKYRAEDCLDCGTRVVTTLTDASS